MGPFKAIGSVYGKRTFEVGGRAGRSEFWWNFPFFVIVALVAGATKEALPEVMKEFLIAGYGSGDLAIFWVLAGVFVVVVLYLAWCQFCVSIRRLHDIGRSGWWFLLNVFPLLGGIALLIMFCFRVNRMRTSGVQNHHEAPASHEAAGGVKTSQSSEGISRGPRG